MTLSAIPTTFPTHWASLPMDGCLSDPNTCGCNHLQQTNYQGSINVTQNGFACKRWDQTTNNCQENSPNDGLEENFCCNPDEDIRSWCMIIHGVWNYCNVPICEDSCSDADPETCGCEFSLQSDYRGFIGTARSRCTCQRSDSHAPHKYDDIPENYPRMGLADNNHCCNPNGNPGGAC